MGIGDGHAKVLHPRTELDFRVFAQKEKERKGGIEKREREREGEMKERMEGKREEDRKEKTKAYVPE